MVVWVLSDNLHSNLSVTGNSSIILSVAVTSEIYSFMLLRIHRQ